MGSSGDTTMRLQLGTGNSLKLHDSVYSTNLTDYNNRVKTSAPLIFSNYPKAQRKEASIFDVGKLSNDTARQIDFITATATPKERTDVQRPTVMEGKLESLYSTATVKDPETGQNLPLNRLS